jgi:alkylation response protein AidB-like acyl-CoA dehydrogenase
VGVQATTHRRVAKVEGLLRCARAYVYEVARILDGPIDPAAADETSASVRLACAFACETATQAVDIIYDSAGGTSIYETSRIERCFRDVHVVSHHVMLSPPTSRR